ncbi:Uncharacterised protein [uncultured archaeon]|nr:Uncharacterised protein [uncultured archaeon]
MSHLHTYLDLAESLNNIWKYLKERVEILDRLEWKSLNLDRGIRKKQNPYQIIQL